MRRLALLPLLLAALWAPSAASAACTTTVASVSAAQSAVTAAAAGSTVCLADGTYGSLSLAQVKTSPGVTLAAQHPGAATLGAVTLNGKWLAVVDLKMASLSIGNQSNASDLTAQRDDVAAGLWVGSGSSTVIPTNVSVLNNIVHPSTGSEPDAVVAQRYVALRVEDNLIYTAQETGNHCDGFQSIWGGRGLTFKRNWIKDGNCQGFFLKDGAVTNLAFEDNLIANRSGGTGDSPFQIYDTSPNSADPFYTGKTRIYNNTIWSNPNGAYLRDGDLAVDVQRNVIDSWNLSGTTSLSQLTQDYNVIAGGTIGRRGANDVAGPPQFTNTATYDYRLKAGTPGDFPSGRAGITWDASTKAFGPASAPADTTPPQTTITQAPVDGTATDALVAFQADEPSTFECRLDAAAYAACISPQTYSGLSVGSHTVSVRATDAAGNVDPTPATATWTVQAPPPDCSGLQAQLDQALADLATAVAAEHAAEDLAASRLVTIQDRDATIAADDATIAGLRATLANIHAESAP
jgi:hypothetical protein